ETLLRYLPSAPCEKVEVEVVYALDALALSGGRLNPVLIPALKDPMPARRAVAASIVGRLGDEGQQALAPKDLKDEYPRVRRRAAQGSLAAKNKDALPVLVALLAEPSVEVTWQAEELLHWLAGDDAPNVTIGAGSVQSRQRCRDSWVTWLSRNFATFDWT